MSITEDIIDLDTENCADEGTCEILTDGDDDALGYDDKLSEVAAARIRDFLPRHTQWAGEAGSGYIEALTEAPTQLTNGTIVTKVGQVLVAETNSEKAGLLRGQIYQDFVGNGQLLELTWTQVVDGTEIGYLYLLTLDGIYLKGFKDGDLASLAYRILKDHNPAGFTKLLARVIAKFYQKGLPKRWETSSKNDEGIEKRTTAQGQDAWDVAIDENAVEDCDEDLNLWLA